MAVEVEYALRGDISIAYQAIGDGPVDIIFGAGLCSHLDLIWGDPYATAFMRRLGQAGRLLLFDKPGTGLSDPIVGVQTVEQRMDDFLAVLDAVGSKRAVVIGFSEASTSALLLAATHPERVEALIALSGFPRSTAGPGFLPEMESYVENELWRVLWESAAHWGDGKLLLQLSPHVRNRALYRRLAPSLERASASPGMARAMITGMRDYDVTAVLPAITVPTLVIHRTDEFLPVAFGRAIADGVDGAKFVELPGDEHMCYFAPDEVLDAIEGFIGGSPTPRSSSARRLATVLFTDIVDSTVVAADLGDEQWRELLARHDAMVAEEVERHEGTLIKTLGDGAFAAFDRPLLGLRCALALCARADELNISIRAGLHAGECEVLANDLAGIAVHIGARIVALAGPGEVVVSSTVKEIVYGSGVEFENRGEHELKGVPGEWTLHAVVNDRSRDQRPATQATPEEASQTPAPSAAMRPLDRVIVSAASRAPTLTRAGLKVFGRARSRQR